MTVWNGRAAANGRLWRFEVVLAALAAQIIFDQLLAAPAGAVSSGATRVTRERDIRSVRVEFEAAFGASNPWSLCARAV